MQILMIAPEPFFTPRGTPISVHQRLLALSKLGHEVDLLTYHIGDDLHIKGVRIHRIPKVPLIRSVRPGPSGRKVLLDILLFLKAFRMLLGNRYDVIHTHEEASFFSIPLAALFRGKHLYDRHSSLAGQLARLRLARFMRVDRIFNRLEKRVIRSTRALITIGNDLADGAREIDPRVKQTLLENLAIQASFAEASPALLDQLQKDFGGNGRLPILYSGNLQPYQGIDLLIDCAEIVTRESPQAEFLILGGSSEEVEYWRQVVQEKRLSASVRFLGTVGVEEMLAYLETAVLVVSPRRNGMSVPLKLYTYLHAGKPIVATDVSAHTQLLSDQTSVLVAPNRVSLADGILRLLGDANLRLKLGQAAKELSRRHSDPQVYLQKLQEVYAVFTPSQTEHSSEVTTSEVTP